MARQRGSAPAPFLGSVRSGLRRLTDLLSGARTPVFASFWHGELDPLIRSCLASFPYQQLELRLFSYNLSLDVPPGVQLCDARQICRDIDLIDAFFVDGRPTVARSPKLAARAI